MLGRLRLKTKVQPLPGLTGIAFLALIVINISHGRDNTARLEEIERGHFPALEASRELVVSLEETRRIFRTRRRPRTRRHSTPFVPFARASRGTSTQLAHSSVVTAASIADLRTAYGHYVEQGMSAARRLIGDAREPAAPAPAPEPVPSAKRGPAPKTEEVRTVAPVEIDDAAANLTSTLETLTADYNSLQAAVKLLSDAQRTHMAGAFVAARQTSADATRANVIIGAICLVALLLLTFWTMRSVVSTLAEASGFVSAAAAEILAVAQQTEANAADEAAFVDETRRAMDGLSNPRARSRPAHRRCSNARSCRRRPVARSRRGSASSTRRR